MKKERIVALVPVAGLSSRMGEFKPLLPLGERTLIEHCVGSAILGGAETVTVVTGYRASEVEQLLAYAFREKVNFVYNKDYAKTDMMHSVKIGVDALPDCDAFFLLPGDMPLIAKETFSKLIMERRQFQEMVTMPVLGGRSTHPPLIDSKMIPVILSFEGEGGLRKLWETVSDRIRKVMIEDVGAGMDADTPQEYWNCRKVYTNRCNGKDS